MKPITLKMTAFGPYKDEEVIEFSNLHAHGIFVVSGSTGAGKTTIFDAITYALYDAASGTDRDSTKFLRSDFADEKVDTEVELVFEVKGRIYKVWRKFNHTGGNAKREIYELINGEFEPAVEKFQVRPVNNKVEEILGLTQSQFNQIVMLPQGEFQKLLTSESKHKEEIFRQIFKTERFVKMTEILRDKREEAKAHYERAELQQQYYIQQIVNKLPQRDSQLFDIVDAPEVNLYQLQNALQEEETYYEEQILASQKQVKKAEQQLEIQQKQFQEQQQLNERIAKFQQRKEHLKGLQEQEAHYKALGQKVHLALEASKLEVFEQQFINTQVALQRQQDLVSQLTVQGQQAKAYAEKTQQLFEQQKLEQPKQEMIVKEIQTLEALIPVYEEVTSKQAVVVGLQQQLQQDSPKLEQAVANIQHKKEQITILQQRIEKLEGETANFEHIYDRSVKAEQGIQLVKKTIEERAEKQRLTAVISQFEEKANDLQQQVEEMDRKIHSNHAAFLAATLEDNLPCPVCGSESHPAIHLVNIEQVDEKQLAKIRTQYDTARQELYTAQSKKQLVEQGIQQLTQQLEERKLVIDQLAKYEAFLQKAQADMQVLREQQKELEKLKPQLRLEQQSLDAMQIAIEQQQRIFNEQQQQLKVEEALLQQSLDKMPKQYATLTAVKGALSEQQQILAQLKQAFEAAQQNWQTAQTASHEAMINVQNAQQRLTELQVEMQDKQQALETALAQGGFEDLAAYQAAKCPSATVQQYEQEIQSYQQQVHTLTVQIQEDTVVLEGKVLEDLAELEQQVQEAKVLQVEALQLVNSQQQYKQECETTLSALQEISKEIEAYKANLKQVEQLYNLIRGQNEQKISFERFVQIGYLEMVTNAANERLKVLSNGQFYLRCTGRKVGNAQSGLSIDVYDSNTGQTRDVKTLSGGEKFNASLALALGMADVIQGAQGSVQIETMFIDEGFGTLDGEALQKAINILHELQKSGRLIGVISHVDELKAQMPAILQVRKLKEGISKTAILIK